MTRKNPENFVKVSPPVSKIFDIFHFPKVYYTLVTESLYSDEYSFTFLGRESVDSQSTTFK